MTPQILILATLIVQSTLLSITFPISELWTTTPMLYNDNALNLYYTRLGHGHARPSVSVGSVGYDPTFSAGYPFIMWTWSSRLPWLLARGLHGLLDDAIMYKLCVFAAGVVAPVCVPLAVRRLGADVPMTALAAVLAVSLWWASWFHWFFIEGMWSFVTVAYFSVPYVVAIIRYLEGDGGIRRLLWLGAVGAALFFTHPLFPIAITCGTLLSVLLSWPELKLRRLLPFVLVVPTLSLLPNVRWLIGMQQYLDTVLLAGYFTTVDGNTVWKELIGTYHGHAHGSKVYAPIALLTVASLLLPRGRMERRRMWIFGLLGLTLIWLAAVGGASVLRNVQPNRFAPVGYLFLTIPAVFGFRALLSASHMNDNRMIAAGARVSLVVVGIVTVYCLYEVFAEVSSMNIGHYGQRPPQVRPLPERIKCVEQWLESETTRQGRVLFEVNPARGQASDVAYHAYKTNREFIGGPAPWPLRSGILFTGFVNGNLFGQSIGSIGERRFMQYIDLYNIGWIAAYSSEAKVTLGSFSKVAEMKNCEDVTVYRVKRPLDYFLEGRGAVVASGYNDLVLDGLEGSSIVLKYNYVAGLKSEPAANIVPVSAMERMPPLIRIVAPPRTLRLYLEP